MKTHYLICGLILILWIFIPSVPAQDAALQTYDKDGLSFSYPSDWKLLDKSTDHAQHLILTRDKSAIVIVVIALRTPLANRGQIRAARTQITEFYVEQIKKGFKSSNRPTEETNPCIEIAGGMAAGVRISGWEQNEQSIGEVYPTVKGRRFVNLVYMKTEKEGVTGDPAWAVIRKTLRVSGSETSQDSPLHDEVVSGGVLNGKALRLPKPEYPSRARAAGAQGTVAVQVTIDEQGNVLSAQPLNGHPLLHESSVRSALGAKFKPTLLCDVPVKVTGIITYNFVRL